jgi:hypothetical protein
MKRTSLLVLALITAVVVLAAIIARAGRRSDPVDSAAETLYPTLSERVNDVYAIAVTSADEAFTIARHGEDWGLENKGGYPVKFEMVKEMLLGLAELRIVESKTSNPEYHDRLGLARPDADGEDDQSTLITLRDGQGQPIASLIVGNRAESSGRSLRQYVRRADEAQTWLVEGSLNVNRTALNWIDRELLRLPRTRVQSVSISHADGESVHIAREDEDQRTFTVSDVPDGHELQRENIADSIAGAVGYLRIEDVAPAGEIDFAGGQVTVAEFRSFDGLLLTIELLTGEDGTWISLCAAPEDTGSEETVDEAVAGEIDEMNQRFNGWAFKIGSSSASSLMKRMADLTQPIEPETDATDETEG